MYKITHGRYGQSYSEFIYWNYDLDTEEWLCNESLRVFDWGNYFK